MLTMTGKRPPRRIERLDELQSFFDCTAGSLHKLCLLVLSAEPLTKSNLTEGDDEWYNSSSTTFSQQAEVLPAKCRHKQDNKAEHLTDQAFLRSN